MKIINLFCVVGVFALSSITPLNAASKDDIVGVASKSDDFTILVKALKAAGLVEALQGEGPLTVFAPTDEAFMRLPKGTLDNLLKPENKDQLINILTYHVVKGEVTGSQAVTLNKAKALNEQEIDIEFRNAALYLNDAKVVATDIKTTNGVIHVIDSVILPPRPKTDSLTMACEKILTEAVDVGVDLFNGGNTAACESVYKIAVTSIIAIKPPTLSSRDIEVLEEALKTVENSDSSRENAWTLRRAMDATMKSLFD